MAGNLSIRNTTYASGSVAAPGALATIANLGTPVAGLYHLEITVVISGTVADPADRDNMRLVFNTVSQAPFPMAALAGFRGVHVWPRARFDGINGVIIRAIGAGTVGSIYHAAIAATPISEAG